MPRISGRERSADPRAVIVLLMSGHTFLEAARQLVPWSPTYRVAVHHLVRSKGIEAIDLRFLNSLEPYLSEPMIEMLSRTRVTMTDVYDHFAISPDEVDATP